MMDSNGSSKLILMLGADWWGSDARALAAAFRRQGHALIEKHPTDFNPVAWTSIPLKIIRRLIQPLTARNYNEHVRSLLANEAIDFVVVFKGLMLSHRTVAECKSRGVRSYCFYPDVSLMDHGDEIWNSLPLYDCLFTTKSFHLNDPTIRERVRSIQLVSHGYDPEIHRPLAFSDRRESRYRCDVSFVGCWSPKKEQLLTAILEKCPEVKIRIWGPNWYLGGLAVRQLWEGRGAWGDELALVYLHSRINLGLLSEAGTGTRTGDQTTARTWQIPATGGFLLHESTEELAQYFKPGKEVGTFPYDPADPEKSGEELVNKVMYYLSNETPRQEIAAAGFDRCIGSGYTYGNAARQIIAFHDGLNRPDE